MTLTTTTEYPRLIGLSGWARAGKDTVAARLVSEHGYTKIGWADLLRACVVALDPVVGLEYQAPRAFGPRDQVPYRLVRYTEVLDRYGYEGAKSSPFAEECRGALQKMGTEVGRNLLGADIWVQATMNSLDPAKRYVFIDCRFPNEADAVRDAGGKVLRVRREGVGPANDHASETSLDDYRFDVIIDNDATIEALNGEVDRVLRYLGLPTAKPAIRKVA